jgi:hypothetical protein
MRQENLSSWDSGNAGPDWTDCDDVEGTDELSDTLLGSITPAVGSEEEYEDGGTICRSSSGKEPDLGVLENAWIEDATMEWSNHAIALRASAEVVTHSLDNPGEGAPDVQVGVKRCDVGAVGLLRDLDGPERDSVVCGVLPLVPHFEGEENYRYEMTNLPVAEGPLAPNNLLDYALKLLHENVPECRSRFCRFRQGLGKFVCRKRKIGCVSALGVCRKERRTGNVCDLVWNG